MDGKETFFLVETDSISTANLYIKNGLQFVTTGIKTKDNNTYSTFILKGTEQQIQTSQEEINKNIEEGLNFIS